MAKTQRDEDSHGKFFLTTKNVFRLYREARTYTDVLNEQFDEFQRIGRNEPHPDLDPKFPRLGEGSTSSWLDQKPRSLIQTTPSGDVTTESQDLWLDAVGQEILDYEIVPNANEDYPAFEKVQTNLKDAFNFGFKATTCPFYEHGNGKLTPDMTAIFWGDTVVPQGYQSIKSMPYTFFEGWWPPEDVKKMANDTELADGGWNMENLKAVADQDNTKGERSETPAEKRLGLPENYVHVVVGVQDGVGAPSITFAPDDELILRVKKNPDPRGVKNMQVLYGLIDGTNPFGYSIMARVGAWQNLMDNDAQAYQYNRAYNLNPAVVRKGTISAGDLHPGAEFEALGPDDGLETIDLDSSALTNYPETYDWQRGVLLNMLNSPTSAGEADAPLGTTPKGIATASSMISTDDLTYIEHVNEWWGDWCETALNIYFGSMMGVHQFTLHDKTFERLEQLIENGTVQFPIMAEDGTMIANLSERVLTLNFDAQDFPIFRFTVKGGSSKVQDETAQLQALDSVSADISQDAELASLVGPLTKAEIYNKKILLSGIHDNENLLINTDQLKAQLKQQDEQSNAAQKAEEAKPPAITIAYKDLEPIARVQALKAYGIDVTLPQLQATAQPASDPTQSVGVKNAVKNLATRGVHPHVIPQAIEALTDNVPLGHILAASTPQPQGA